MVKWNVITADVLDMETQQTTCVSFKRFCLCVFCRKAIAKSGLQHASTQPNVSTSGQSDLLQPSSTIDWTVSYLRDCKNDQCRKYQSWFGAWKGSLCVLSRMCWVSSVICHKIATKSQIKRPFWILSQREEMYSFSKASKISVSGECQLVERLSVLITPLGLPPCKHADTETSPSHLKDKVHSAGALRHSQCHLSESFPLLL